jgi:hypothetical protein
MSPALAAGSDVAFGLLKMYEAGAKVLCPIRFESVIEVIGEVIGEVIRQVIGEVNG